MLRDNRRAGRQIVLEVYAAGTWGELSWTSTPPTHTLIFKSHRLSVNTTDTSSFGNFFSLS